jgi:hypothetical protein
MLGSHRISTGRDIPVARKYQGPADRLELYEILVAGNDAVQRKGTAVPYTSRNGHMFSFLDKTGSMALRLPKDSRMRFMEEYATTIAEQYGRQMKEYVVVPGDLLARTHELRQWFDESHQWIGTLKPKPTKRS